MSKKNQRAYLDDISANKPARKSPPSRQAKGSLKTSKASFSEAKTPPKKRQPENERSAFRQSQNERGQNERSPNAQPAKQRVTKAKKLIVRAPNQKIQQRADFLKEQRADLSRQEPERLQKILAASGVGSRRQMEEWIGNGWVQVNGKTAQLGDKVSPDDQVTVKGSAIKLKWADRLPRILLYYKQEGEIVSRDDPQGRVSVFDRLPQAASAPIAPKAPDALSTTTNTARRQLSPARRTRLLPARQTCTQRRNQTGTAIIITTINNDDSGKTGIHDLRGPTQRLSTTQDRTGITATL